MKKILLTILAVLTLTIGLTGCGETRAAYKFGSTVTIELPANMKLQDAGWADSELWYLTRPMKEDEEPEVWSYNKKTTFGIIEGQVIFIESKE